MYAVIRPALRSTSTARPPTRLLHHSRCPSSIRLRSFHTTRSLAQTPNPPPSSDSLPVDENNGDKHRENAAKEAAKDQTDAGVVTEDPESIAQKLQRSKEMTRRYTSALRRTQRRNRAQDLPPIHIPNWFLQRRVRLREEFSSQLEQEKICLLKITHKESGEHATCPIPFWSYSRGVRNLSQITRALWMKGLTDEQRKEFARDFAQRIEVKDEELVKSLEQGEELLKHVPKSEQVNLHTPDLKLEGKAPEDKTEISMRPVEETDQQSTRAMEILDQNYAREQNRSSRRISPLILSEIRATIAASLSAVHPTTDSFPSAKTNLILHSPSNESEILLKRNLGKIAQELEADTILLYPQDLAQLIGDYIGEGPEPSPHSIRSLGYETYKIGPDLANDVESLGSEDAVEEDSDAPTNESAPPEFSLGIVPASALPTSIPRPLVAMLSHVIKVGDMRASLAQSLKHLQSSASHGEDNLANNQQSRAQSQSEIHLEDLKIAAILDALIDSAELKRSGGLTKSAERAVLPSTKTESAEKPSFFNYSIAKPTELDLSPVLPPKAEEDFTFTANVRPLSKESNITPRATIIHIMDIKELSATQHGGRILQKLEDIVRKRRSAGENIMLVGTTCSADLTPELSSAGVQGLQSENESSFFRTIVVPTAPLEDLHTAWTPDDVVYDVSSVARSMAMEQASSPPQKMKFRKINLWHIRDMLLRLDPDATRHIRLTEHERDTYEAFGRIFPKYLMNSVLTYDEVHRIALTSLGLHITDPSSDHLSWAHVALAMGLLKASDEVKFIHIREKAAEKDKALRGRLKEHVDKARAARGLEPLPRRTGSQSSSEVKAAKRQSDIGRIAMNATKHEKRLMPGIANPDQIKTTFDQVHVPKETVDAIRTLTSLSLIRPDAFDYGVLATEKISGALLYGPPGTGKTLLAKAVAKESGSMVLEVSGSSIMDKYVGEGEKNVTAIFSLARKLSPCIVFIDEADAILASRNSGRERTSHRDILNQFLKEWDGLNDLSVFVMVATNRPFDLDDAVIRRLPRRLLVDLPAEKDREEILKIHLRGEQLDQSVDLGDLAKRTPLYSGSDLKNVAVSAALACVKEENENAALAAVKAVTEDPLVDVIEDGDVNNDNIDAVRVQTIETLEAKKIKTEEEIQEATALAAEAAALAGSRFPIDEEKRMDFQRRVNAFEKERVIKTFERSPKLSESTEPQESPKSENREAPRLVRGQKYDFPEKRTLHARHFDKALQEISASISEDMSSLSATKKFDEQYGDRKGRRKKNAYGFGSNEPKESDARVRG